VSERILVVDDEAAIVDAVSYALEEEGFEVASAGDGAAALAELESGDVDLVVLDLRLPKLSGIEVCRRARAKSSVPIIMLTARDAEVDRVHGLEIGADDYVTKPFSMAELVARVRALLRRRELDRAGDGRRQLRVGDVTVDLERQRVVVGDRAVRLTGSEFRLLTFLARDPGRTFRRREIMQHLWESEFVADERACDVHVSNLRRKLEEDPGKPQRLVTVRGLGYQLVATGREYERS
jgi:two-component system, OmpR family, response regulator RegX3